MQDQDGINFTDPFILSATETARNEEKPSQAKNEKSSCEKNTGNVKMFSWIFLATGFILWIICCWLFLRVYQDLKYV